MAEKITIKLVRSRAGKTPNMRKCLDALGLKRREVEREIKRTSIGLPLKLRKHVVCATGQQAEAKHALRLSSRRRHQE